MPTLHPFRDNLHVHTFRLPNHPSKQTWVLIRFPFSLTRAGQGLLFIARQRVVYGAYIQVPAGHLSSRRQLTLRLKVSDSIRKFCTF